MASRSRKSCLFSFPDLETPLGRVHFGGYLPGSTGTGLGGYRRYGMYAAVLILNGEGIYRDVNGHKFALEPGSVIAVFPELAHHYGPTPGRRWDEIFVAFSGAAFDTWRAHGLDPAHPVWHLQHPETAGHRMRDLLEREVKDFADCLDLASCVHQLLGEWLKHRPDLLSCPPWLMRARACLAVPQDRRPLQEIAAETGLHPDAFRRAFRKWTGEAPSEFRRRHRLAHASNLLRRHDLTLAQIAASPSISRTKASSSCAITDGIPTRCAASGSSRRMPNPWTCPRAMSSTFPHSSPAGFRPRSGANSSRKSGVRHVVATPLTWEADPLLCPRCHKEMRIVALIDEAAVIERILRHLGLWEAGVRVDPARDPPEPVEPVIEPWLDDPFPDYDNEPVFAEN